MTTKIMLIYNIHIFTPQIFGYSNHIDMLQDRHEPHRKNH
jgi:hypothetical protein